MIQETDLSKYVWVLVKKDDIVEQKDWYKNAKLYLDGVEIAMKPQDWHHIVISTEPSAEKCSDIRCGYNYLCSNCRKTLGEDDGERACLGDKITINGQEVSLKIGTPYLVKEPQAKIEPLSMAIVVDDHCSNYLIDLRDKINEMVKAYNILNKEK